MAEVHEPVVEEGHGPLVRQELHDVRDVPVPPADEKVVQEGLAKAHQAPEGLHLELLATQVGDGVNLPKVVDGQPAEMTRAVGGVQRVRHDDVVRPGLGLLRAQLPSTAGVDAIVVQPAGQQAAFGYGHVELRQQLRRGVLVVVAARLATHCLHAACLSWNVSCTSGREVAIHRVQGTQKCLRQLRSDLAAVEAIMAQVPFSVLALEATAELAERTSPEDRLVCRAEGVVHDEAPVVHKTVAVQGVEDVRVHVCGVRGDEDAAGQQLLREA
mmetsp:Transcript_72049/g.215018  ORF Transcript_72049/g.215018 Transcript_72049/m.215018 type:complete len:271 (+) Transcript_72049:346-1158(+)